MSKLKNTKLKHKKHKDSDNSDNHTHKKYKIVTSKNKNKLVLKEGRYYRKNGSMNKKNKRSRKYLNMRTLDALKTYGSTLKDQDGGGIISYLKFKWNMRKIKQILEKLGKNKVEMNEFIHSYEKQPETFKRLGDKKAVVIYDILRTIKDKTIIQFLLDNKDKEKTYDTSNMEHDLYNIKTKIEITTANQLKQYNKEIEKEKPKLAKNLAKFKKDSQKFRKINEEYSKLMAFYEEQRELSDKYNAIKDLEKLTSDDKVIKNKYLKNEENIKYILSYKQEDINELNNSLKKIATLMNMADDYDTKFKDLTEGKYETDLQKWQSNYKDIYVNITNIEGGIKNVNDTLEKIKEYADQIGFNLSAIYSSIKQNVKLDPILKIKRIIDENIGYLKNVKEVSLKKVKYAFIEQIPIEKIEFYLPLASAALIQTEKSMNELNASFILDSSFIRTGHAGGGSDRWKGRRMGMDGVGGSNGINNIGELEWFGNGGATAMSYDVLLKLNIDTFLETDYRDIIETLKTINDDVNDTTYNTDIYKLKNYEFLNIMKIYFNIYVFFLHYFKSRDSTDPLNPSNNTTPTEDNYKNSGIILNLLSIITKYEIIIKDNKDSIFKELPNTVKTEIQNYISNVKLYLFDSSRGGPNFITEIESHIKINYFDNIGKDKNIWNPFKENNKFTLKNLYYEYNPYASTAFPVNDLDCIKSFIGYYNKKDKNIIDYENKSESELNKNNLFAQGALHNKYDNIPVIYKYNDGAGSTEYKFIVIYDVIKTNHPSIKIKVLGNSDAIDEKFNNFINFLAAATQLNKGPGKPIIDLKNDVYNSTKNIRDDYDKLYCNFDSNKLFETIINNEINKAPYLSKICDDSETSYIWSMSYMKQRIIKPWTALNFVDKNSAILQTIWDKAQPTVATKTEAAANAAATAATPAGANPGHPTVAPNKTFKVFYNNEFEWLKTNIIPLILRNIYNNVKYDETIQYYTDTRAINFTNINKTDITNNKLLTILNQKDTKNNNYYIIVYEFDNTPTRTIIKKEIIDDDNKSMQKYVFTWLKSDANSDDTKKLKTDTISDFIYKLYENTSKTKTPLSTLDVNNIVKNEFCNAFNNDDKKNFIKAYTNVFNSLSSGTKYSIVLKEDKVVNTLSNPILARTETRLVFDLPQSDKFNEEKQYNSNSSDFIKKTVLDIITKSYNKKDNYKNIIIKYVKRIVSFNVNNWNRSIDSINLINPKPDPPTLLLTDPKNAITFIKTKLPDTDVLGFLDYSLYSNGAAANRHIKDRVSTGVKADITVDNKYSEELIKNELKLNNYFIKNDNYDNVVNIPILDKDDNMFLGKALYYDDKKTTMSKPEPLCNILTIQQANDILYSEVLINKKPIGLYLINIYTPLKSETELKSLIDCINNHTKSQNLYETVIMGTFTLNNTSPAYKKEKLIDDMKTFSYNQFGNIKETCINKDPSYYYIDLCFVSDDFEKYFTILNDDIVVPSGSVSSHYPIYLDIIENQDIDIEDDDFVVFYGEDNIVIDDIFMKFKFNLTLKKKPTVGGSKSSLKSKPKPKYTPKIINLGSNGSYDIEMVDSSGNIITDDRYKTATIDKITNIITIQDKNGKTSMTIDKGSRKITRFEEDGTTVESTSVIDKDGTFITTDKYGKEYKTKDGADGKSETKDISTGEVVKTHYEKEDDELKEAKQKGERLLSTFMDDVKKENLTMVSKNRDSILSYIKKIIDLVQTRLKPKNYEDIKLKIDALAKNIIELKAIEPKLTPDKVLIKEYAQKARSYDWMEDVTKREKISLSLEDEAKELEAIIKTHPEIKDILPSSSESITRENILDIISETDIKLDHLIHPIKPHIQKILDKLKNKDNVNTLIKFFEDRHKDTPQNMCTYLIAINNIIPSILLSNKLNDIKCYEYSKNKKEKEKEKYQKKY